MVRLCRSRRNHADRRISISSRQRSSNIGIGDVDFTVTGFFDGRDVHRATAATTETIGFTNLDRVQFARTSDAGIDNIELARPEPASLMPLVAGFARLAAISRRRRLACV
jgi:hypothetical protein